MAYGSGWGAALPKLCPSGVLAAGAGTRVLGFRVVGAPGCRRELPGERFPAVIADVVLPVLCSMSFHEPEGYIDSTDYPPLPLHSYLECTYNITVYTGYGVELQVRRALVLGGELHGLTPLLQGSK